MHIQEFYSSMICKQNWKMLLEYWISFIKNSHTNMQELTVKWLTLHPDDALIGNMLITRGVAIGDVGECRTPPKHLACRQICGTRASRRWNARKEFFVGKFGLREVFIVGKLWLPPPKNFPYLPPSLLRSVINTKSFPTEISNCGLTTTRENA